jgi:hypothetical protein
MATIDLHDVIIDVLRNAGTPLRATEIVDIISRDGLYLTKDKNPPDYNQIYGRIGKYPHLFSWKDGIITLRNLPREERLFRLTWNTKGWELPIKHDWHEEDQGKTNVAFENQYGFGGEEWLFNARYLSNGFQYGYIRGAKDLTATVAFVTTAYLFTIHQESGDRYLVGKIENLEIIQPGDAAELVAHELYNQYLDEFVNEIEMADGDSDAIQVEGFQANVRFKLIGNELFEVPKLVPGLRGRQYNRFIPYKVTPALLAKMDGYLPKTGFKFNPGIATASEGYERHTSATQTSVKRHHTNITNALVKYLAPEFTENKKNLSVEKTDFGSKTADIVLQHADKIISIIEVKTSAMARKNIREAMGQLLDYALWFEDVTITELIIVAPSPLSPEETAFFIRLQNHFKLKISYWQFLENAGRRQTPFLKLL